MTKVFLGGTCNNSPWRSQMIPLLEIDYFDPVIPDGEWNDECYERELREREECDYCLYVITPAMTGFYSIAEVIDDSNKRPEKTIMVILTEDGRAEFTDHQLKSLEQTAKMVRANGGKAWGTLEDAAEYINRASLTPESNVRVAE